MMGHVAASSSADSAATPYYPNIVHSTVNILRKRSEGSSVRRILHCHWALAGLGSLIASLQGIPNLQALAANAC